MKNRKRNRMKGFDYSSDNIYFVTICTKYRLYQFGEVVNKEMILNVYGEIVERQIDWLGENYPYFRLHNGVVMPNHVHLLFDINSQMVNNNVDNDKRDDGRDDDGRDDDGRDDDGRDDDGRDDDGRDDDGRDDDGRDDDGRDDDGRDVGTGRDLSLREQREQRTNENLIKIKPVSDLMGALKTTSSKQIHLFGNMDFRWQRSFHDHIVRDANRYDNIYCYISENPARWEDDSLKDPDYSMI